LRRRGRWLAFLPLPNNEPSGESQQHQCQIKFSVALRRLVLKQIFHAMRGSCGLNFFDRRFNRCGGGFNDWGRPLWRCGCGFASKRGSAHPAEAVHVAVFITALGAPDGHKSLTTIPIF
jgi:hypothetical protein